MRYIASSDRELNSLECEFVLNFFEYYFHLFEMMKSVILLRDKSVWKSRIIIIVGGKRLSEKERAGEGGGTNIESK